MTPGPAAAIDQRRRATILGACAALVLALVYLMRIVALGIATAEGDVPPVSVLQLPEGSEVLSEERVCGSDWCWLELQVEPPRDVSPSELAASLGLEPGGGRPGTWWDPRSISMYGEPATGVLDVSLSYW